MQSARFKQLAKTNCSGFTLIELLVVIALIVTLIAMVVPSLKGAMYEARAAKCATQTRQWANAFNAFTVENKSNLPAFANQYPGLSRHSLWYNQTAMYIGLETFTADDPLGSAKNSRNWYAEIRKCPAGSAFVGVHYGGFNSRTPAHAPINYQTHAKSEPPTRYPDLKLVSVKNPSGWAMLFDTVNHFMYSPNGWLRTIDMDEDGIPDTHNVLSTTTTYIYNGARPREHMNATNIGFVDTHVERIAFSEWLKEGGFWKDN